MSEPAARMPPVGPTLDGPLTPDAVAIANAIAAAYGAPGLTMVLRVDVVWLARALAAQGIGRKEAA